MRANAPWGAMIFQAYKRRPGAVTMWVGRFLKKKIGPVDPPGRYKKTRKKEHTSRAHSNSFG